MALHSTITLPLTCQSDGQGAPIRDWIGEFDEHLRSGNLPYAERRMMRSTAKQFIHWCKTHCPERFPTVFSDMHDQRGDAETWNLRERFLHEVIPDRDLRHLERARLVRFLNHLNGPP
jgi:hypothetical protein